MADVNAPSGFYVMVLNDGVTYDHPKLQRGDWELKHGPLDAIDATRRLEKCKQQAPECKWAVVAAGIPPM